MDVARRSFASQCRRCLHLALAHRIVVQPRTLCIKEPVVSQARCLHSSPVVRLPPSAPQTRDRGPKSDEDTQTDFAAMNVLANTVSASPNFHIGTCVKCMLINVPSEATTYNGCGLLPY